MKKVLRVLLGTLVGLIVLAGLFFGLGVLGNRFWITTQLSTIFWSLVLPFLLIATAVAAVVSLLVVRKGRGGKAFFRVTLVASLVAFAVLGVKAARFKMVARDAGGSYSLLEGLTLKDIQMSKPDEQVVYTSRDGQDLSISIYKPSQTKDSSDGELRPVYVYMHGGGWSSNDADTNSNMHRQMADAGYVGFSINYRLCTYPGTDNPTWDKAIYDCADAMNWIREHAKEYGGDPGHMVLAGESAGGNLVLHYAGMTSTGQLDAPVPQAVLAMYPVVDLQWTSDNAHYMTTDKIPGICEPYIGGELGEYPDRVGFVSPLTYMSSELPPVLILHGEKDTLVDVGGSEEYKRQADKCGADVTLAELPYSNHGTDQQVNRTVLLNWLGQFPGMTPQA